MHESRKLARDEILKGLKTQIVERHPDVGTAGDLKTLFKAVMRRRCADESDPFRILAGLKEIDFDQKSTQLRNELEPGLLGGARRWLHNPTRSLMDEMDVMDGMDLTVHVVHGPCRP